MGRKRRPHLPGGTFHVVTRCQGREAMFTPELRTRFVALLREEIAFRDAKLFAYVVMPNHVHLIVQQGREPLWRLMQALLRRAALAVLRAHRREGHVFERRYRAHICGTPDHFRNAIVYTHLNPVRAGLCAAPSEYAWSSHGAWLQRDVAADGGPHPISLTHAAQAFATAPNRTPQELASDYLAYLDWRNHCDSLRADDESAECPSMPQPPIASGDAYWAQCLASPYVTSSTRFLDPGTSDPIARPVRPDLAAIASVVLRASEPTLLPDLVRSRWGGPAYVRARRAIIEKAAAAGYRGTEIAAYLRISPPAVSAVLTAQRKRFLSTTS